MMARAFTPEAWRARAQRRLPKPIFDFIDGGSGDEEAVRRNRRVFDDVRFVPQVLKAPVERSIGVHFLGESWKAPIGVSPMGLGNLAWPGTDRGVIGAVGDAGLAYSLSMAGSIPMATAQELMTGKLWFQLYLGEDFSVLMRLMQGARDAGVEVLMLTVDAAWPGLRLRDRANGFGQPLWHHPASLLSHLLHPRWSLTTLLRGIPSMVNLLNVDERLVGAEATRLFMASMVRAKLNFETLQRIRDQWQGLIIVKGVLDVDDAVKLKSTGVDGVVVSNHGGRQLGSVVTALEVLPGIRHAVGSDWPLLFDSGVRTGEDVARALALGADFVLLGRPWLFSSAADGPDVGPAVLARRLADELDNTMAQIGCRSVQELRGRAIISSRGAA